MIFLPRSKSDFESQYLQIPRNLNIGDDVKIRPIHGFSIDIVDDKVYEVVEFLDKGDVKIKEKLTNKTRIINSGRLDWILDEANNK